VRTSTGAASPVLVVNFQPARAIRNAERGTADHDVLRVNALATPLFATVALFDPRERRAVTAREQIENRPVVLAAEPVDPDPLLVAAIGDGGRRGGDQRMLLLAHNVVRTDSDRRVGVVDRLEGGVGG